jgi:two-component system KDP operon response regulator KdpE
MVKKKILWADDDEDLTLALKPTMEQEGWDVRSVSSAEEAKNAAVDDRPDLIVMDIIMESEHGFSAIEDLKSNSQLRNIPVIVFSSLTHRWSETTATREDALLSEAVEFVDKTAGADVLIHTIHKHLST